MRMTIQSQVGTVILSLGACRLYAEPIRICNLRGLRRVAYLLPRGLGAPSTGPRPSRVAGRLDRLTRRPLQRHRFEPLENRCAAVKPLALVVLSGSNRY
jgi:hypothetical protein